MEFFIKSCMFQPQDAKIPIVRRISFFFFFCNYKISHPLFAKAFFQTLVSFLFFFSSFRPKTIKLNSKNFQPLLPNDHCTFVFFFFLGAFTNEYFIFESWKIALKLRKKFLRKVIRIRFPFCMVS